MNIASLDQNETTLGVLLVGLVLTSLILLVLVVVLFIKLRRQEQAQKTLWAGKTGADLETILMQQVHDMKNLDQEIQELFEISNRLRELCLKSVHKFSLLRFNPFKETGGNQSFSLALLDGKNSGMVVSSLHTREGTRVYAKPISKGEADGYPLTDEEREAIAQALKKSSTPNSL